MEESTQNFTPVYKEVAYARSTWQKVREFQLGVKGLVVEVPLVFVREYLSGGERRPEIGRAVYEKIDRLQEIRRRGITAEDAVFKAMAIDNEEHETAAESLSLLIGEGGINGDDIRFGFSAEVYAFAPSLKVYERFMWFDESELNIRD